MSKNKIGDYLPALTRGDIINVARYKINQGCCCQYVSDGIREWYGIDISPEELDDTLSNSSDLLPAPERERNAWEHILHNETDNLTNVDRFYLQRKYGYDWKYMDAMIEAYNNGRKLGQQAAIIREGLARGWMTLEQAVQQLIDNTCLSEDEAKTKVSEIIEEVQNEKEK